MSGKFGTPGWDEPDGDDDDGPDEFTYLASLDERTLRVAECRCCDGNGEICVGSTSATWTDPPEAIFEPCPDCNGTGESDEWEETEAVTLNDTTGVLVPADIFYKWPGFWPFDPLPVTDCRPCPVDAWPHQLRETFASIFSDYPEIKPWTP